MGLAGGLATNGQAGGGGGTTIPPIAFGTAASRPTAAPGNANTAYYATDTGEVTFSDGAAWQVLKSTSAAPFTVSNFMSLPAGALPTGRIGWADAPYIEGDGAGRFKVVNGGVDVIGAGFGLAIAEGANAKQGTATLAAGSVVVANTSVTANSRIFLTGQADGGAPGWLRVSARTAGTSFTVTSSSGTDTSTFAYEIFEPG